MRVQGREAVWPSPQGKYQAELGFEPQPCREFVSQSLLVHGPHTPAKAPQCTEHYSHLQAFVSAVPSARNAVPCVSLSLSMEAGEAPTWIPAWLNRMVCPKTGAVRLLSKPCKSNLAPG